MDTIIVIIAVAAAVWYLYRRFKRTFDPDQPGCGCAGCGDGSCGASNTGIRPVVPDQGPSDERDPKESLGR